jgi:saccharopine dehydrogenase-like NADP-dependent oxidoreductase
MKEKTLRYPGHAALIQSMIDKQLFDKNNFDSTVSKLFNDWKLEENEPEFTVLDINIYGSEKNIHYHLYDEMDVISKSSSMARTTGYTATATINMLLKEIWSTKGVSPPELVGVNEDCINFLLEYLSLRSIKLLQS